MLGNSLAELAKATGRYGDDDMKDNRNDKTIERN